jgi:serine O-acetyltransferase
MPIQSKADLKYYLEQDRIALKRRQSFFHDDIWKFEILLRKAEYFCNCYPKPFNKIGSVYKRRMFRLGQKCGGFNIHINCFGPGLSIAHFGPIVVNTSARIGKNCRIHEGVTIGATGGSSQAATIGDNVFIATGAKVIGNITIGSDIAIGANAVVTRDFTETGITLGGVPAKKISNHNSHDFLAKELLNL